MEAAAPGAYSRWLGIAGNELGAASPVAYERISRYLCDWQADGVRAAPRVSHGSRHGSVSEWYARRAIDAAASRYHIFAASGPASMVSCMRAGAGHGGVRVWRARWYLSGIRSGLERKFGAKRRRRTARRAMAFSLPSPPLPTTLLRQRFMRRRAVAAFRAVGGVARLGAWRGAAAASLLCHVASNALKTSHRLYAICI